MPRVRANSGWADALDEPGGDFRELIFEPHLPFEVGDRQVDRQPQPGPTMLGVRILGVPDPLGVSSTMACRRSDFGVLPAPEAPVPTSSPLPSARINSTGSYSFSLARHEHAVGTLTRPIDVNTGEMGRMLRTECWSS
jgi:hypothetical protein